MKTIWVLGAVYLVSMGAFAQADLTQGNDGTASYGYTFDLPAARGRYQPRLALCTTAARQRLYAESVGH